MIHDQGAYTPQGINLPYNAATGVPGPYILPAYELRVQVAETNKVATMPVRGAGYPEAAFAMERALDRIAQELSLDPAQVRERNLVPPQMMPYVTPLKTRAGSPMALDSGDFPAYQRMALAAIDYAGFPARQREAYASGRYLGIGIGNGVKGTGRGPFEIRQSCASAAPGASRSTRARCRWAKGSKLRLPRSAPSNLMLPLSW